MEDKNIHKVIEGRGAMLLDTNPCYQTPSKSELEEREAMFLDENPCYRAPSKFKSENVPTSREASLFLDKNPCYTAPPKFNPENVSMSRATKFKYKKAACGCSILLVGFILVGSAAFTSMDISLWTISRVSLSISKLEMIIIELLASKYNTSMQIMELQTSKKLFI